MRLIGGKWIKRAAKLLAVVTGVSLLWPLSYSLLAPVVTPLMIIRLAEGEGLDYRWVNIEEISPHLSRSVIGAEDSRFCEHFGFDFEAIEGALQRNREGKGTYGASTLSMQTAKNAFLWPARSWVRKGAEAYFTLLIEIFWSKRRIAEIYLNIAEWGPGIYGAEAAAQHYFNRPAKDLSADQAALMAAILPNPRRWSATEPTAFIRGKAKAYRQRAAIVQRDGLDTCILE